MNYTSLSNFLNNTENIINNTITNEQFTTIKAEEGNVVLMSEQQFACLSWMTRQKWCIVQQGWLLFCKFRQGAMRIFIEYEMPVFNLFWIGLCDTRIWLWEYFVLEYGYDSGYAIFIVSCRWLWLWCRMWIWVWYLVSRFGFYVW